MNKDFYRRYALEVRSTLNISLLSTQIIYHIKTCPSYQHAQYILSYLGRNQELDLTALYQDKGKKWFVPVVMDQQDMRISLYTQEMVLSKNRFGILEPAEPQFSQTDLDPIDLIILPGLMADRQGYRLGYGKGYYDRFLSRLQTIKRIPLMFPVPSQCMIATLPHDPWDIKVDILVTECEVIPMTQKDDCP